MSANINGDKPSELFPVTNNQTQEVKGLRNCSDEELQSLLDGSRQGEVQCIQQAQAVAAQQRHFAQMICVAMFELDRRQKTFGLIVPR